MTCRSSGRRTLRSDHTILKAKLHTVITIRLVQALVGRGLEVCANRHVGLSCFQLLTRPVLPARDFKTEKIFDSKKYQSKKVTPQVTEQKLSI